MRQAIVALVAALALSYPPAAAAAFEDSPTEAYAACMIGQAVVRVRSKMEPTQAVDEAWKACEHLAAGIGADEAEGVVHYVELVLDKLAA